MLWLCLVLCHTRAESILAWTIHSLNECAHHTTQQHPTSNSPATEFGLICIHIVGDSIYGKNIKEINSIVKE